MRIYTIAQQKGGAAKSTVAADLAAALAKDGQRVLAIDCDASRNFTQRLGHSSAVNPPQSVLAYTAGVATAADLAVPSETVPGVDVIRANTGVRELPPEETTMLRDLLPSETAWDACVIDTPGDLSYITLAAVAAADVLGIPVECKAEGTDGLDDTHDFLNNRVAKLRRGKPAQEVWCIPTRMGRNSLAREVLDLLHESFPGRVTNPVRENVAVADAYVDRKPASVYDPKARGSLDLQAACRVLITGHLPENTDPEHAKEA